MTDYSLFSKMLFDGLLAWNEGEQSMIENKHAIACLEKYREMGLPQNPSLFFRGLLEGGKEVYGTSLLFQDGEYIISGIDDEKSVPVENVSVWTGYCDMIGNPIFWGDKAAVIFSRYFDESDTYIFDNDIESGYEVELEDMRSRLPHKKQHYNQWYWVENGDNLELFLPEFIDIVTIRRHEENPHFWLENEDNYYDEASVYAPEYLVVVSSLDSIT